MITTEEIEKQRQAIVNEAKTWIGTPFLHARNVKGAGADCQSIISNSFGLVFNTQIIIPSYSSQWHLHSGDDGDITELYIESLFKNNCVEISAGRTNVEPYDEKFFIDASLQKGDIVLARMGRTYCHGAIVVDWPTVIQGEAKICGRGSVQLANANASWYLSSRVKKYFSWRGWHDQHI